MKARRLIALFLVLASLLTMVPAVFAAEGDTHIVEVQYLYSGTTTQAANSWSGSYAEGSGDSRTITVPYVVGYNAVLNDVPEGVTADLNDGVLTFSFTNITAAKTITVAYVPADVNFTVNYYQQNAADDDYTLVHTETKTGKTNAPISNYISYDNSANLKVYEGSYALWFDDSATIAADGSTVVEIYYDRDYYLMTFDLGGGYGVDPIYARYGASIGDVGTPTRPGYTFECWVDADGNTVTLPTVMRAENVTYYAKWNATTVNYKVVYWYENANDDGYSYVGQSSHTALAGSTVSSSAYSDYNFGDTRDDDHFTYNGSRAETKTVAGDGTTVLNVYFTRNVYTVYFKANGQCALEAHTHTEDCYQLVCTKSEHSHDSTCELTCGETEHTTHTTDCYSGVGSVANTENWNNTPKNPSDGQIYKRNSNGGTYYIYISGMWYTYTGNTTGLSSGSIINPTCNSHKHTADCYSCGSDEHVHSEDNGCYSYVCGKEVHTHTDACESMSSSSVVAYITAKYQADISSQWPIAGVGKVPSSVISWQYITGNTPQVTKIFTMVDNLCVDGGKTMTAATSNNTTSYTINYMLESLDGTGTLYNRTYYTKSTDFSQTLPYTNTNSWGAKQIDGYTAVTENANKDNNTFTLYYNRLRYTLTMWNPGEASAQKTVSNVMYEMPLNNISDNGTLVSTFTPSYPSNLEENAYVFSGKWYTTPDCLPGSEVNWESGKMPNGDMAIYAKWVPVTHNVTVYIDKATADANDTALSVKTVAHREFATEPAGVTNEGLAFVGWFYMDNGVEKAFDFSSMRITKDMVIYGKWKATNPVEYTIRFQLENGTLVADTITGKGLPFTTITGHAKAGDELYTAYQVGYFPDVSSHSITLSATASKNLITFVYKPVDAVPYTVKYLDVATGQPVVDANGVTYNDKVVSDNRKSVVTENAQIINGYLADAVQKRLIVTADGENVLIFWYSKDETHAYVTEVHYTTRNGITSEYRRNSEVGDIGKTYSKSALSINGYVLDYITVNGTEWTGTGDPSAELTSAGLTFEFYYIPNEFYVHHQATGEVVAYQVTDTFDLTSVVSSGYLYGGHYAGALNEESGNYESDYSTTPLTESGLAVTPVAGDHFFIKEVSESYLQPRIWYWYDTRNSNKVMEIYLVTAVDNEKYQYVGFDLDDDTKMEPIKEVAAEIKIQKFDSTAGDNLVDYKTLTPNSVYGLSSGYLNIQTYSTEVTANQEFTFNAFWITPDNVKVTGTKSRTYSTGETGNYTGSTDGLHIEKEAIIGSHCIKYETQVSQTYALLTARTTYTMVISDEPETYTITLVDGKTTTTETVEAGDYTGTFAPAGKKGYVFAGWYTDSAYTTPADFSDVQSDMTIYAKYIKVSDVTTTVIRSGSRLQTNVVVPTGDFTEVGFEFVSKTQNGSIVCSSKTKLPVSMLDRILGKNTTKYQYSTNWMLNSLKTGTTFTVIPYWVTSDGTVVHGEPITYLYIFGAIVKC